MTFAPLPGSGTSLWGVANAQVTIRLNTAGTPAGEPEDIASSALSTTTVANVLAYITESSSATALEFDTEVHRKLLDCFLPARFEGGAANTIKNKDAVVWNTVEYRVIGDPVTDGPIDDVLRVLLTRVT